MNNDTIVDPAALSELVRVAQNDALIGIVGSKIYYYAHPKVIWFAGGSIRFPTGTSLHKGDLEKDEGQYDEIMEVDYITGCSLLIKKEVIAEVGLMDERFFLVFEEVDWNQRASEHGYKILYVPLSKIWHKVSARIGADSPTSYYYIIRNSLLFTFKHRMMYIPTVTLNKLIVFASLLFHKRFTVALAVLSGLIDFYLFRFGQMKNRA